jgi:predicted ATP-grasp superfamily ATP-dependent carboligase
LFADRDLIRIAETVACPVERYPDALPQLIQSLPPAQILYTGGLENDPHVLRGLAQHHELEGTPPEILRSVRDPFALQALVADAGMAMPQMVPPHEPCPPEGRWLRKPLRSSGGRGIRFAQPHEPASHQHYFQEYRDGTPISAVFVNATLFGVTEQLIGVPWLHAKPFAYCGNIGPIAWPQPVFERLAHRVYEAGVRGVWGVDLVQTDDRLLVLEINPRYTASVEVLEHGYRRAIFAPSDTAASPATAHRSADEQVIGVIGKAIYYAPHTFVFPHQGPWDADLARDFDPWKCPHFADVPQPGSRIEAGYPVLSILAIGNSPAEVRAQLQWHAVQLDQLFRNSP